MSSFADQIGDLPLLPDGSGPVFVSGKALARDRLRAAFGIGKGTWTFDRNKGFPYPEIFDNKSPDLSLLQAIFVGWLKTFDFVTDVRDVRATFEDTERHYSISFEVVTKYGVISDVYIFTVG